MGFNRFTVGAALRATLLALAIGALIWVLLRGEWPVVALLIAAAVALAFTELVRFATAADRALAHVLEAIAFDDAMLGGFEKNNALSPELTAAMETAMEALRRGRAEGEEQARYLQTLLAHMPVALMACDAEGRVQLLNTAARRLFEAPVKTLADCARYGEGFVTGLGNLKEGQSALLPMERPGGRLDLKVAATAIVMRGGKRLIFSLQNIAVELSAQELAAWQTVIRTMAHEVMNSLTPISSLAATAGDIVRGLRDASKDESRVQLDDATDALETVARRAEGLSVFVQTHRRLTHRLTAQPERMPVRRIFARLQRLLASDIAARNIALAVTVEPEALDVTADADLIDQALINLLRNAMDAVRDRPDAAIALSAHRDAGGHTVIAVADNGAGIAPDQRGKIFVPFYTTKPHGTGIGLTLIRQIAAVHGATVSLGETAGGGATFSLRF